MEGGIFLTCEILLSGFLFSLSLVLTDFNENFECKSIDNQILSTNECKDYLNNNNLCLSDIPTSNEVEVCIYASLALFFLVHLYISMQSADTVKTETRLTSVKQHIAYFPMFLFIYFILSIPSILVISYQYIIWQRSCYEDERIVFIYNIGRRQIIASFILVTILLNLVIHIFVHINKAWTKDSKLASLIRLRKLRNKSKNEKHNGGGGNSGSSDDILLNEQTPLLPHPVESKI